jgi:8-oxo-dGTP diphosphatase
MDIWPVTGWNGMPANLVPEEHDAIAWFTAEELTSLEMAHDSYPALLRTVL